MKGRGSNRNVADRFASCRVELDQPLEKVITEFTVEFAKTVITTNRSPDVPFEASINPYRGCEHGCSYCYARPSHAYLGYSPGLDFETRIHYKKNAAQQLRQELAKRNYRCVPLALGNNTDAYQPVEQRLGITREIIQTLYETNHPVTLVTKSSRVQRDIDLLAPMAAKDLAHVFVSITTLKTELSSKMEPRACAPHKRLQTISKLRAAGIPVGVLVAPVIPGLTEMELEHILSAAAKAGAQRAGYVMLRLPYEVNDLFFDWLQLNYPLQEKKVRTQLQSIHSGREYRSEFGLRMTGQGPIADLIAQRFQRACRKLEFFSEPVELNTALFVPPTIVSKGLQMPLF